MYPNILAEHDNQRVSFALPPLLREAYDQLIRRPPDFPALKAALERLLVFLCSKEGRTHANCVETDRFFFQRDNWPVSWEHLPDSYTAVLGDIGGLLHDAIAAPEIADNFESSPEQLLDRVSALPPALRAV